MNKTRGQSVCTLFLGGVVALLALLLAGAICMPNFIRKGPSKTHGIIARLRLIDGAKQQWALDHHQTNDVIVRAEDIGPYLRDMLREGEIRAVASEHYRINRLGQAPEAELTRELEGRPRGTVIKLEEVIPPGEKTGKEEKEVWETRPDRKKTASSDRR